MDMMNGVYEGDLVISHDARISGVVTGNLLVTAGTVRLDGEVRGSVRASGGTVTIMGIVQGRAQASGGKVRVAVGASVNGRVLSNDKRWIRPGGAYAIDASTPLYDITELDF